MLSQLFIENIAVIEKADITFFGGFNVLSGETGAGKSIIIDSLNAIMGGRVSRELIRTGEKRAVVVATFTDLSKEVNDYCTQQGFGAEGGQLSVRREMHSDGRNICRINGVPASLQMLKALGSMLVSIHGQHDGQHLLDEALHIEYLDSFGGLDDQLNRYLELYEGLLQLNRRIKAISMSAAEKEKHRTRLVESIDELSAAAVKPGEQAELAELRLRLISGEHIAAALAAALALIDGAEEAPGALACVADAAKALKAGQKYSREVEAFGARMSEILTSVTELSSDLSKALLEVDYSAQLLEDTESRLELLSRLCKKYGLEADGLEALEAALAQELEGLDGAEQSLDELNAKYIDLRAQVSAAAEGLHAMRETAAGRMREKIEAELHLLDMPSARFSAEVTSTIGHSQARFTKRGTDTVRFLLTTNSGEELKPLTKVASGGELSRIMLALKTILSKGEEQITAVFDEVDAGVSGRAASHVGEKLYAISRQRQVLCVTHLPQIACMADRQFYIEKNEEGARTYTRVSLLDREGRVQELARLTAGVHITDATLEGARQLLAAAEKIKKR